MLKNLFIILFLSLSLHHSVVAQTREELEKERVALKKEIEETEKQLNENKVRTKENLVQFNLISKKVNLQDRVIDNINRDLYVLNNNMYTISKDIRRYDKLLDTLKDEYSRSMIYAYKNKSNYEFLNFIFSASNFNDAIKRISYLKSYRTYREMQGQNIARMQNLRKKKVVELNDTKQEKNQVLDVQSKEKEILENQKKEKDRIIADLKKKGKQLNKQITAKQKQMQKVNNAIAEAIKKAIIKAKEEALAKEKERLKVEAKKNEKTDVNKTTVKSNVTATTKPAPSGQSILLNDENIALNNNFEKNRGSLPWPLDKGFVMMHYGKNTLPSGSILDVTSITISSDVGSAVKAVFDGTVTALQQIDDMSVVIIQHGKYFTTYSNLTGISVRKGQQISRGQVIGKVAANLDGIGSIDFYIQNESANFDPERWLRRR
jgi:septal ring factor EnvC (AmiA/AmiB activator)